MEKHIAVIEGDGIGPEIVAEAVRVLERVQERFSHKFHLRYVDMGGRAIDRTGTPLPEETLRVCRASDAVLLGAVGGPKWDDPAAKVRPEQGLLGLRAGLGLYANLRPLRVYPPLADASPLKREIIKDGFDMVVVRELTGGIYFGERGRDAAGAFDTERYSEAEVERIARTAFTLAMGRKRIVHSVDKANVLETSRLWREVVERVGKAFPQVEIIHVLVDNAAMQLVRNPAQFDVLLTNNIFGDILSDEASQITGSIGMLASASTAGEGPGLYEPIHGSAPDIAGQNKANPIAAILSAAMLLDISFGMKEEAAAIDSAVNEALAQGLRTPDIAGEGCVPVGTGEMGKAIAQLI